MPAENRLTLRPPTLEDGMNVFRLIAQCPPLDENSSYCNLLQCSHFAETSVAAERDGQLVGFISGYCPPDRPNTLFIWQVAVAESARGLGLAARMVRHLLQREATRDVRFLETTITDDNRASWALFRSVAAKLPARLSHQTWLERDAHFDGQHDSEQLVQIGPINPESLSEESDLQ